MIQFTVNEEACVRCGECVRDCPMGVIAMRDEIPSVAPDKESMCIRCQHCLAVCPTAALSILGKNPEDSLPLKGNMPTADQMETLLRGRRSVRHYKQENVDKAVLDRLLTVARTAPTGKNSLNLHFLLVDDKDVMQAIRTDVYDGIRERMAGEGLPEGMEFFGTAAKLWGRGVDLVFRGAPHMLWVTAPKNSPSPEADPHIALSYFELMAAALGLGTVWCGFGKWVFTKVLPHMKAKLGVPENHTDGYVMMFGTPDIRYYRTVQRDEQATSIVSYP
ncbi:nitroreductase family protein [Desulfovibrio mangrovi]|uniref:nitroreductase family protein n=1 Tax=Desulfovibrio mangrovi TaxID=2976983 RepID=UPI0022462476|nr:nitroreductase family protein [Desulfovibrio mangrovi]UZP66706.1 nitroreductase family protein [Desulfovibrio mangrovi]